MSKDNFFEKTGKATPIITSIYTADPSAVVGQDGRMYIYASHDCYPRDNVDNIDRYHVFSSDDLTSWIDEGEILRSDDVEWGIPSGGYMWAPDCAFKNGKYYFYFPHPDKEPWGLNFKIGVAVSDYPAKDFKVIGYVDCPSEDGVIDPNIFIDDDGRNYLYYGGIGIPRCVELEDDMITIKKESVIKVEGLHDYHEGPWVFKRNGIYYMTYPDNFVNRNRMAYAISDSPMGPWKYKGFYLSPTGSMTSHGSVVSFKGKWYCFYHNCAISNDPWLRSVCMDELFFEDDGSIKPVIQTSKPIKLFEYKQNTNSKDMQYGLEKARLCCESISDNETTVAVLNNYGDRIIFKHINGFDGGRFNIRITYSRVGHNTAIRLVVNSDDQGAINIISTALEDVYSNIANFTVKLRPGKVNEIRLEYLDGRVRIKEIFVEKI